MHPAAKRAFWIGFFVIWFDFTWNNIPLLPNIVGYGLLAWALAQFALYGQAFRWASASAVGLAGAEAIRLLVSRLSWPLFISRLDPWTQIGSRLGAVPLLLSAALYWFVSSGFIACLLRLDDSRSARRLGLVRAASLILSLLNAGAVLWRTDAPKLTLNIASPEPGLGALVLVVLLIGLSEIALWAMALRRLPSTLHPVFPQPISLPRTVKLITWALLGLALIGVASIPLGRAPQAPRLLSLAGGAGVGSSGSRASWSPDGRRLAVGGTNLPARVYDPATGAVLFDTRARAQYDVHDLAWSPDGARLLSAGTGIFIDDGRTGAEIACIAACPGPSMWTEGLAWSPDGHTLALAANRLHLFDTRSMTYTQVIEGANASRVAYSPDGSMIATAAEREAAHVWTSSGQLLNEFAIADGTQVRAIAWSPDGKRLAIAADYNVVEIWDVASGERVQALLLTTTFDRWLGQRPHHNPRDLSTAVAWSPDGRFLAAGSSDASAGVWELASGDQVLRLNGQTDFIGDIEFSPDGRRIATASQDRTVWVWDSSSIYE